MKVYCVVLGIWVVVIFNSFFSASLCASPSSKPSKYIVTDLGVEVRTSQSGPVGINDDGDIAGTLEASATSGEHRAFLYHRGKIAFLSESDLRAAAINNHGQVACFSRFAAFLWEKGKLHPLMPLPSLFGGFGGVKEDVYVTGLSDSGKVIGNIFGLDGVFLPFLWQNGTFDIPQLSHSPGHGDLPGAFSDSRFELRAINKRGQITGFTHGSIGGGSSPRGVLWNNGRVDEVVGGGAVYPYALNDKGQLVGLMYVGTTTHAFLWEDGILHDLGHELGTMSGSRSEATSLNAQGQIVGIADFKYEEVEGLSIIHWGGDRAVLWQDNQAYNLNDLIPKDSGWILERAVGINNHGRIVGVGHRSRDGRSVEGLQRIFLLTPFKS